MNTRKILSWGAAAAALAAGVGITPAGEAQAQQAAPAAKVTNQEEVVVTARKKEETLLEAPIAVTAYTATQIQNLGLQSIDDIAAQTPGLSFSKAFGRSSDRPVMRGQASILATVQSGVESGTAFFVDGVYYAGDIQSIDLNDLARVEVIKGPQSALYGRNTYAGAVNYITKTPGKDLTGEFRGSAAQHGEQDLNFRIAGGLIGDTLTGSLAGRYYKYGGEWNNVATGETLGKEQTSSISGVLNFVPNDNFRVKGRLTYLEDRDGPRAFGFQRSNVNNCFPGFRSNQFRGPAATTDNNPNQYFCGVIKANPSSIAQNSGANGTRPEGPFMGVWRDALYGQSTAEANLPNGWTATLLAGFRNETRKTGSDSNFQNDNGGAAFGAPFNPSFPTGALVSGIVPYTATPTGNGFFAISSRSRQDDYSVEARLASAQDQRLRWLVGLYGYASETRGVPFNFGYTAARNFTGPVVSNDKTANVAYFGSLSLDITEKLTFDLEGRQASESRNTEEYGDGLTNPIGRVTYADNATFKNFTPRATLTYKPMSGTTLYSIYSEGVKPGGLNGSIGLAVNKNTFAQETSQNVEVGWKQSLFGGRGAFTLAAYDTVALDYQLTTAVQNPNTLGITSVVTNQGKARIQGFEADFRAAVTDRFNFGVTYAYTDPRFSQGCDEFQYTLTSGGLLMSSTPNVPRGTPPGYVIPAGASCSIKGKQVPLTSKQQASFNVGYTAPSGMEGVEWFARANGSYASTKYTQVHNTAETGETTLLNARIGLEAERWSFTVFGKNITDDDSITIATRWFDLYQGTAAGAGLTGAAATGVDTGGPRAVFYGLRKGQQVGAEMKVKF